MLLGGAGGAEVGADFGVDLVPGAAGLLFQVAAQGLEVFVKSPSKNITCLSIVFVA